MQLLIQVNKFLSYSIFGNSVWSLILILILTIRNNKNVTQKQLMTQDEKQSIIVSIFGNISWDLPAEQIYLYDDGDPDEEEDWQTPVGWNCAYETPWQVVPPETLSKRNK